MLAVGLPLFLRMNLPWRKKAPLIGVFSLGIFTILAAVLNKVYSFTQPFGSLWTYWYTRESSTALLVANIPFCWTLWRRVTRWSHLTGKTRNDSDTPDSDQSRKGSDGTPVADGKRKASGLMDGFPRSAKDLEMAEGVGGGWSFADMLGEQNPASKTEKEPTPFTHPHLFYGRNRTNSIRAPDFPMEKALLSDRPQQETSRRDSDPEGSPKGTPQSTKFPSLASKKSAGSFI